MTEDQSRLEQNLIKEGMTFLENVQMMSLGIKILTVKTIQIEDSWNFYSYKAHNITSFRSYASTAVNQLGNLTCRTEDICTLQSQQ